MDSVCKLPSGEKVLVELQVTTGINVRSANVYAGQLKCGGKWKDVKRVVSLSILGASRTIDYHWHQQFKKHFIFRDIESSECIEEGIEILQYSILDLCPSTKSSEATHTSSRGPRWSSPRLKQPRRH